MGRKFKVRLTEQQFSELLAQSLFGKDSVGLLKNLLGGTEKIDQDFLKKLLGDLGGSSGTKSFPISSGDVQSKWMELTKKVIDNSFNFGLGLGIDYGGFGTRFTVLPDKHVMLFIALGYNLNDLGVNAGGGYLITPDKKFCPYFIGMYGYNAVIVIENASRYNKTYYGPSFGFGMEFIKRFGNNFWNIELLAPLRSTHYEDDLRNIKNNPQIRLDSEPPPFAFSVGYHFG